MTQPPRVAVSPRHFVTVDDDYLSMIERAPQQDFVVRTLARRTVGEAETPLMTGELVIAGRQAREEYPLAKTYPLHFRKTYYPGRLHGDPRVEFESHTAASSLMPVPAPIGFTRTTFRSCLLPGQPYSRLSPFGSEPEESNITHARRLTLSHGAGLWQLATQIWEVLSLLQEAGLTHGDAELHNFIVTASPLELLPIDFEMAVKKESVEPAVWERRRRRDWEALARESVYLQCALGPQSGPLAELGLERAGELFRKPDAFLKVIEAGGAAQLAE